MLIIALVLAVIGLAALVTAVVTSNEVIAWVCIGASVIGVLLLIIDALRERKRNVGAGVDSDDPDEQTAVLAEAEPEDYPDEPTSQFPLADDDTDTTAYSDETERYDETSQSDETGAFGTTAASSESDTTAVAVDDEVPSDEQSDRDESTRRD